MRLLCLWDVPGKNTGVVCHFLLQDLIIISNTERLTPRLVGAQYTTGEEWRNNTRKNEQTEPKQKQHPVFDTTGDGSKV